MRTDQEPVVLMADDDEDDCLLARDAFEESGADGIFRCVEDGIELIDYLSHSGRFEGESRTELPAVILLDLNMPRKDGRQALKEIKAIPVLREIPIVVLTTSSDERDKAYTHEMGAQSFITKPPTFDEWIQIMKSLAENWLQGS